MIITAIVLWVVALAFILITLKNMVVRGVKTRHCTAMVQGTVTEVKEKVSRREDGITHEYTPTVQYKVDGVEYSKKFTKAYNVATYQVGQSVEIMYNPDKPAEINKVGASNTADLILLGLGVVIGLVGAGLLMFV